jgi:AraC family transcriptional regulator
MSDSISDRRSLPLPSGSLDAGVVPRLLKEASASFGLGRSRVRPSESAATLISGTANVESERRERCLGGLSGWQIKSLRAYIEQRLQDRVRISDLADHSNLSRSHFGRSFKISFGLTPQQYIRRERIARAKTLMLESNESIARIAAAVGLCDQAHLTRVFNRLVGGTPNHWRRTTRSSASNSG